VSQTGIYFQSLALCVPICDAGDVILDVVNNDDASGDDAHNASTRDAAGPS